MRFCFPLIVALVAAVVGGCGKPEPAAPDSTVFHLTRSGDAVTMDLFVPSPGEGGPVRLTVLSADGKRVMGKIEAVSLDGTPTKTALPIEIEVVGTAMETVELEFPPEVLGKRVRKAMIGFSAVSPSRRQKTIFRSVTLLD